MTSLQLGKDAYNRALLIQKWQKAAHPEDNEPDERSLVSRLCEGCCRLYREIVRHLLKNKALPNEILISLKRSYDHLRLWDDAYKVSDGNLDATSVKSSTVDRVTVRILTNIARILTRRLVLLSSSETLAELAIDLRQTAEQGSYGDDLGDESSDDAASNCSALTESHDIREISKDLSTATDCLMDLEPLYKDPAFDVEPKASVKGSILADWKPEQAYCDRIAQRFSQAEEELVSRLGKANFQRYLRCKEERDVAGQGVPTGEETTPVLQDGGAATIAPSSKFHDSGIGSSLPTLSYAETVMSYGHGDGRSVRIPPLPEEAKKGTPFECVACGQRITVLTNSTWKKHLFSDLQLYLCLDLSCMYDEAFLNRNDWVAHIALEHHPDWKGSQCPLCREDMDDGQFAITRHLGRHLEEIALASLPAGLDSVSGSETSSLSSLNSPTFPCAFAFAGCSSTFGSKNPWKRHIVSQHLCLQYYRCSSCPSGTEGNEFNSKDSFSEHLYRVHMPFALKREISKGGSKILREWEDWEAHVEVMQQSCLVIRQQSPQRSACPKPDCASVFEGPESWDEWTEHVGRHLEKGEARKLGVDRLLARWALGEGIIERDEEGEFIMCSGRA